LPYSTVADALSTQQTVSTKKTRTASSTGNVCAETEERPKDRMLSGNKERERERERE